MNLPGEESGKKVNRYKGLEGLLSTKRNENGKDASGGGSLLEKGRGFDLKGAIKAAEKAVVAAPQLVHQEGQDQGEGERGGRTGEKHERASSSTSLQGSKRLKRIHSLPMDWSLKKVRSGFARSSVLAERRTDQPNSFCRECTSSPARHSSAL